MDKSSSKKSGKDPSQASKAEKRRRIALEVRLSEFLLYDTADKAISSISEQDRIPLLGLFYPPLSPPAEQNTSDLSDFQLILDRMRSSLKKRKIISLPAVLAVQTASTLMEVADAKLNDSPEPVSDQQPPGQTESVFLRRTRELSMQKVRENAGRKLSLSAIEAYVKKGIELGYQGLERGVNPQVLLVFGALREAFLFNETGLEAGVVEAGIADLLVEFRKSPSVHGEKGKSMVKLLLEELFVEGRLAALAVEAELDQQSMLEELMIGAQGPPIVNPPFKIQKPDPLPNQPVKQNSAPSSVPEKTNPISSTPLFSEESLKKWKETMEGFDPDLIEQRMPDMQVFLSEIALEEDLPPILRAFKSTHIDREPENIDFGI